MHRRVLTLVALLASLASVACDGDAPAVAEDVDAVVLLESAAARMEEVESFRFAVEHENGVTPIVQGLGMTSAQGVMEGADSMSIDVQARFASANVQVSVVVLPDAAYLSNPITREWEEVDVSISDFFDPASGATGLMRQVTAAEVTGRERIAGVDAYVVEATVDSGELTAFVSTAEPGTPVETRVWIGVDDPLVYRIEAHGPVAPGDAAEVVRRIELSAFDEPVEITAPR